MQGNPDAQLLFEEGVTVSSLFISLLKILLKIVQHFQPKTKQEKQFTFFLWKSKLSLILCDILYCIGLSFITWLLFHLKFPWHTVPSVELCLE